MNSKSFQERLHSAITESELLIEEAYERDLVFSELMLVKELMSSQRFAPIWEKESNRIQGLANFPPLSKFDALNPKSGQTKEKKAITADKYGNFHYAQLMRLDRMPDEYELSHFEGRDVKVFVIPGKEMHDFFTKRKSAPAHNGNENERTLTIKKGSPEMAFVEQYRKPDLEKAFKDAIYRLDRQDTGFDTTEAFAEVVELFKKHNTDMIRSHFVEVMHAGGQYGQLGSFKRVFKDYFDKGILRQAKMGRENVYIYSGK